MPGPGEFLRADAHQLAGADHVVYGPQGGAVADKRTRRGIAHRDAVDSHPFDHQTALSHEGQERSCQRIANFTAGTHQRTLRKPGGCPSPWQTLRSTTLPATAGTPMNETLLQNTRGSLFALRELVIALARANPEAAAKGIANATDLQHMLVNSKQPEAFLEGFALELQKTEEILSKPPGR